MAMPVSGVPTDTPGQIPAAHALAREETMWTAAGIGPGARVVDLGCGPGTFLADLADRVGSSGRVTGVDNADEAVRVAGTCWPSSPMSPGC